MLYLSMHCIAALSVQCMGLLGTSVCMSLISNFVVLCYCIAALWERTQVEHERSEDCMLWRSSQFHGCLCCHTSYCFLNVFQTDSILKFMMHRSLERSLLFVSEGPVWHFNQTLWTRFSKKIKLSWFSHPKPKMHSVQL